MALAEEKEILIRKLVGQGILRSPRVIDAFRKVPREKFVPAEYRRDAYIDEPLPIGFGQTISQPLTVAAMTEDLDVREGQKILEIGAGSGYQAAILAEIVGKKGLVVTVERLRELWNLARSNLEKAGYMDVKVVKGDGTLGCKKYAPYDRILVAADAPALPHALAEQLKKGGKIIIPVQGTMHLFEKKQNGTISKRTTGFYAFVPLLGKHGYKE